MYYRVKYAKINILLYGGISLLFSFVSLIYVGLDPKCLHRAVYFQFQSLFTYGSPRLVAVRRFMCMNG